MTIFLIFLSFIAGIHGQVLIDLFYTLYTDTDLRENITSKLTQTFENQIILKTSQINSSIDVIQAKHDHSVVLDLTFSLSLTSHIKELANQMHFIHINLEDSDSYDNWQFFTHIPIKYHIKTLSNLVSFLNWEKFHIISSENYSPLLKEITTEFEDKIFKNYYYTNQQDQQSANLLIGKQIKPTGTRNIVILNEGESTKRLLHSLKDKNILNAGSGFILGSHSIWGAIEDGLMIFVESDLENSVDNYDYEALSIVKLIKIVLSFYDPSDSLALLEYLEKYTVDHHAISNFTLINIQNGQRKNVGSIINGEIILTDDIIYPGNTLEKPNAPFSYIDISMADGITNPGFANSSNAANLKKGAIYAFMHVKSTHILDNFEIKITHTDCGAEVYSRNYSLSCFTKIKDQLGVAFLTNAFAPVCIGNIISLRALNISIPNIGEASPAVILNNKTVFPEFLRVSKDSRYMAGVIINIAVAFGWKNIIAIYENTTGPTYAYKYLEAQANKSHINIVNSPNERMIKANYRHTDYEQYKSWMKNAINLKVRIFVLFFPPAQIHFFEDFYDAGLRRGDAVFCFYSRISVTITLETDPIQKQKLHEIVYGSIIVEQADWVGDYGKEIKKGYIEVFKESANQRCPSFDAAMLLVNGLKYSINRGENFEEPEILNKNLRQQRFTGCSGPIVMSDEVNERSTNIIGIYNMRWNETTQNLYEYEVGKYDIGSVQLLTLYDDIIWYSNTTNIPSDMIISDSTCPFDQNEARYSSKGAGILYGITFGIVLATMVMTFIIWKNWWHKEIEPLVQRSLITFEDYVVQTMIFIDFLQYIAMGPDIDDYDRFTNSLSSYAIINLGWVARGEIFWISVYIVLFAVFFWVYFSAHILFRIDNIARYFICNYSKNIAKLIMPILGNACFLPIVSILLSVFQCDHGIGSELTKSYVNNDCYVYCWKGFHLIVAFFSIFALIFYLPLAIYFRPYWDNSNENINIRARPLFLMVKSLFQVCIIALNKTIKHYNQSLHGLIYMLLLIGFLIFCIVKKPYNYHRCNLWSIIWCIAVIWSVMLSSMYWIIDYKSIPIWISLQFAGWIFLIASGLYLQWKLYPSLLYTEKKLPIGILFKFSLGSSVTATQINQDNREKNEHKYIISDEDMPAIKNLDFIPIEAFDSSRQLSMC